ncbi:hypothetical protein RISK_004288 [Rhodopirellula islandica]|uniref:Uncharacterized protein n=1 Tax=Rhodopirellula islandica TaxID=595434 RepID=A0A0J1BBI4_RHOIS|nr:hypothetical protein RISK_004288 [Rhodopirellula islandica]
MERVLGVQTGSGQVTGERHNVAVGGCLLIGSPISSITEMQIV